MRSRVDRLDERARRALQVTAIVGVRAEPWLLAAIAGECWRLGAATTGDGAAMAPERVLRSAVARGGRRLLRSVAVRSHLAGAVRFGR